MKPQEISVEHEELLKLVGKKIKELRKQKKLTYVKMAEKVGISQNAYNQLELGQVNFGFITLIKVLDYHKISVKDFFNDL